jgi:hypothetical protein
MRAKKPLRSQLLGPLGRAQQAVGVHVEVAGREVFNSRGQPPGPLERAQLVLLARVPARRCGGAEGTARRIGWIGNWPQWSSCYV